MASLKERVEEFEPLLSGEKLGHAPYGDLPFSIFCYLPEQEWEMRGEIRRLATRLNQKPGRKITLISLADLMWKAVEESEGIKAISTLEQAEGFASAQKQIYRYLSDKDWRPLAIVLKEALSAYRPESDLIFIHRAGALAPNVYRVSKLLDEMKGKTKVPCVMFMPAVTEGQTNLKYMGIAENEARGSYHTKVYTEQ